MVLINIDNLSDAELRYIGQQEELDDWENLSREELIDALEELYEDEVAVTAIPSASSTGHRFVKTLTDVESDNDLSLPGVEPLPEVYNETAIHFILKDANWAYAFWSISSQEEKEIEESGSSLVIRTIGKDVASSTKSEYEIDITLDDHKWNIELPWPGYEYIVQLVCRGADGSDKILCESESIKTIRSWFSMHKEELLIEDTFNKHFAPLVSKGGTMLFNRQVRELLNMEGGELK